MKVIIDTDKKTVEVPSTTRKQLEERNKMNREMGLKEDTILSLLNIEEYKVVSKQEKVVKDFTNAKMIEDFMAQVRKDDESKYKEYVELLKLSNVELIIDQNALNEIAFYAYKNKLGARALRQVMEKIMLDYIFNIDKYINNKIIIDKDVVKTYC